MASDVPFKAPAPWWLLPFLLATVLVCMIGFRVFDEPPFSTLQSVTSSTKKIAPSEAVAGESVSLVVDFGNGAQRRMDALPWQAKMTVLDLMQAAADFRPGIEYAAVGSGDSAFLTSIAGIENGAKEGCFWQYWVNDARGDRSFGIYPLEAGNRVLWKFAPAE